MVSLPKLSQRWKQYRQHLLSQVRILVIDDETVICDVLEELLTEEGFQVDTAGSAEDAWEKIKFVRYDLLIVDKNLPGETGVALLGRLQDAGVVIPSVMITGYASPETVSEALSRGASDYIAKPFDDIDLVRLRIRRVLDRRLSDLLYSLIVEELKAAIPRGALDRDAEALLNDALFSYKEELERRQAVFAVDRDDDRREELRHTLSTVGLTVRASGTIEALLANVSEPAGALVAVVHLDECDGAALARIRESDPLLEVVTLAPEGTGVDTALDAVSQGARDFVLIRNEGIDVLRLRVSAAVQRARRRRLNLHLVATLHQVMDDESTWSELVRLFPDDDQIYIENIEVKRGVAPASAAFSTLARGAGGSDRRIHTRHSLGQEVVIVYSDTEGLSKAYSRKAIVGNISQGGMFIEGQAPPLGAVLMVELRDGSDQYPVVIGRVVRHTRPPEPPGFGIQFLTPDRDIASIIAKLPSSGRLAPQ